jgi:hypothetical protein
MPVTGFAYFNSCTSGDDNDNLPSDDCGIGDDSSDVVMSFVLLEDSLVEIRAFDWSAGRAINPRVYLRRDSCDEDAPQTECHDDVPCGTSVYAFGTSCDAGLQLREALLDVRLAAGIHYLVVDTREHDDFVCGVVGVIVDAIPL